MGHGELGQVAELGGRDGGAEDGPPRVGVGALMRGGAVERAAPIAQPLPAPSDGALDNRRRRRASGGGEERIEAQGHHRKQRTQRQPPTEPREQIEHSDQYDGSAEQDVLELPQDGAAKWREREGRGEWKHTK